MTTIRHAPADARPARSSLGRDGHPHANRRSVRYAVDLLGALGLVAGTVAGVFTLVFGGAVVLLAGLCLHLSCTRQGRVGR